MLHRFTSLGSSSFHRAALLVVSLVIVSGCASLQDSGLSSYHDSAFNDMNRAPAAFSPQMLSAGDGTTTVLDPFYMRTQADYYFAMGEA
ncbi:MAG: hypothetical protein EOP06_22225, partial [Proteobacteria bacterium]